MLLNCGVGEDLRVPWTERRSNQSILKEISPEYSLERLMLKLKLQYFGHLMWRADSYEKTLIFYADLKCPYNGSFLFACLLKCPLDSSCTSRCYCSLMLGKVEGRRRRGWQRMRWLDGITEVMDMSLSKLSSWWCTGKPGVLQSMGSQRVRHDWVTELTVWSFAYWPEAWLMLGLPQWLSW